MRTDGLEVEVLGAADQRQYTNNGIVFKHKLLKITLQKRKHKPLITATDSHNLVLTATSSSITDRDYITRMIFKNIY